MSYYVTVNIEGESPSDLPLISDCKYGDTVTIRRAGYADQGFWMYELAIIGYKQGTGIAANSLNGIPSVRGRSDRRPIIPVLQINN